MMKLLLRPLAIIGILACAVPIGVALLGSFVGFAYRGGLPADTHRKSLSIIWTDVRDQALLKLDVPAACMHTASLLPNRDRAEWRTLNHAEVGESKVWLVELRAVISHEDIVPISERCGAVRSYTSEPLGKRDTSRITLEASHRPEQHIRDSITNLSPPQSYSSTPGEGYYLMGRVYGLNVYRYQECGARALLPIPMDRKNKIPVYLRPDGLQTRWTDDTAPTRGCRDQQDWLIPQEIYVSDPNSEIHDFFRYECWRGSAPASLCETRTTFHGWTLTYTIPRAFLPYFEAYDQDVKAYLDALQGQ